MFLTLARASLILNTVPLKSVTENIVSEVVELDVDFDVEPVEDDSFMVNVACPLPAGAVGSSLHAVINATMNNNSITLFIILSPIYFPSFLLLIIILKQ